MDIVQYLVIIFIVAFGGNISYTTTTEISVIECSTHWDGNGILYCHVYDDAGIEYH
jgi:hypothetical protein